MIIMVIFGNFLVISVNRRLFRYFGSYSGIFGYSGYFGKSSYRVLYTLLRKFRFKMVSEPNEYQIRKSLMADS